MLSIFLLLVHNVPALKQLVNAHTAAGTGAD